MSEYDDPQEPTQEELDEHDAARAVRSAPTVRIEGLSADAVAHIVRTAISENYGLQETAKSAVDEAVHAAVAEAIGDAARLAAEEHVRPLVKKILDEGWQTTNQWGEPTGKRIQLADMLREELFKKDTYNSKAGVAYQLFKDELDKALKGPLKAELDKAQQMVRDLVSEEVMGRFRKALKDGLGLKELG